MREQYDENLLVADALPILFERFKIPQDAYSAKTFRIAFFGISLHFPNTPARVKVAKYHDVHHLLTGYPANWLGEAEIGAWELATGCRKSILAWTLNSGAALVGLFINPGAVFRAFSRGRRTKTNLYYDFDYDFLLKSSIAELRLKIGLDD